MRQLEELQQHHLQLLKVQQELLNAREEMLDKIRQSVREQSKSTEQRVFSFIYSALKNA